MNAFLKMLILIGDGLSVYLDLFILSLKHTEFTEGTTFQKFIF